MSASTKKREIVVATHNPHKAAEISRILAPLWEARGEEAPYFSSLHDYPDFVAPEEIGEHFEDIAHLKAYAAATELGLPAIGDDSGLAVDALDGGPGVRSKRFSGPDATDADNNALIVERLADVSDDARGAAFVCALCLVDARGERLVEVVGRCEGRMLREPRGTGGFGYDPLFYIPAQERTMAELTPAGKDAISHRGAATRALYRRLDEIGLNSLFD